MNQNIKKRLASIGNEEAVRFFFKLLNTLITSLEISPENEKLAFNVRNDSRKRISINMNSRLILTIRDGDLLGFMVNQEDLPKIEAVAPIVKQEYFKEQEPQTVFLYFNFEIIRENIDTIQPLWLKSCKGYEPAQVKSQYRKHHIPALYDMAKDENLLAPYFDESIVYNNTFPQIINDLREYLKGEDNVLNEFVVQPLKNRPHWVWVSDSYGKIGNKIAHYEIKKRRGELNTEIHFEGNQQQQELFSKSIKTLPEQVEWIQWQKANSLAHVKPISISDPDILEKLSAQLLYLEEHLGDEVRRVLANIEDLPTDKTTKMKIPLNQILFGPPGTGKTYNSVNKALEIIGESIVGKDRSDIKELFDRKMKEGQIVFTTFHQSMSYEDFIEGIKPLKPLPTDGFVKYEVQNGIFKELCAKANSNFENSKSDNKKRLPFEEAFELLKEDWEIDEEMKFPLKTKGYEFTIIGFTDTSIQFKKASGGTSHTLSINSLKEQYYGKDFNFKQGVGIYYPGILSKLNSYTSTESLEVELKSYVLIIDEINRGNVSQIFGELITLIETDKRLGKDEALEVTLPYSKEKFGVPPNLYILGTMNTADRSVEALDAALRRRFSFEEMPPQAELMVKEGKLKEQNGKLGELNLVQVLNTINQRIEQLLDKDHLIGHSYFMAVSNLRELKMAFQKKIIPLLQEYFFGDYGKIGLVLGKGFFEEAEQNDNNLFADFGDYDAGDFSERVIYKFRDLSRISDDDFISTVNLLLKK